MFELGANIMKIPWSISTTLRNPERLRPFLLVLSKINGKVWSNDTQKQYQTMLIQERVYGFGNAQFYNANRSCKALTKKQIKLLESMEPITYEQAKEIFETKAYVDPAWRGRVSFSPLEKLGLAIIKNKKVQITSLGEYLLQENYDLGEMFFRSFIKWQIPNPSSTDYKKEDGIDIKPFIGMLHLISNVNQKWSSLGKKSVGISKEEFSLFGPTLISYKKIEEYAQAIIDLRLSCEGKDVKQQKRIKDRYKIKIAKAFLKTSNRLAINKLLDNLTDYGDNAIRYFRLTRYLLIRGNGFFIDLEPRRQIEINNLLKFDNAKSLDFPNEEFYISYLANIYQPELPWETKSELIKIAKAVEQEIHKLQSDFKMLGIAFALFAFKDYQMLTKEQLKTHIEELRSYRRILNDTRTHFESQQVDKVEKCIKGLKEIYEADWKSVQLEKLVTLALNALNDALGIKPNYLVGDDNEPTFTAPANKPDIECFYNDFNSVCEVTMLTDRSQWYNEGQPVMRHVRDFEKSHTDKDVYCVFVAPKLHRDTVNTFWMSIKYEYEGVKQNIVPLTIGQLIELLEILLEIKKTGRQLKHVELRDLYMRIIRITNGVSESSAWIDKIPEAISEWKEKTLIAK